MHKCILCEKKDRFVSLLKLKNMPASAQNLPTESELKTEKGENLDLVQCLNCGLVQFRCKPVDYYKDVIRSGGTTSTMRDLRVSQYKEFISFFGLEGKKLIEIGCGRGDFLQFLKGFPVDSCGIENNPDLVEQAKAKGLTVYQSFADKNMGKLSTGPYDAFLSFNFLEHQPDPNAMVSAIYDNLTADGCGLVTVPSLEYILNNNGYYELIKDHIAYYSFDTLTLLFNNNGFEVVKKEIVNRDTLSIYVKKRKTIDISALQNNTDSLNRSINELIKKYNKVALWGASHQGFTLAATSQLNGKVDYIIDSAEFKQNKYSPASHIKIVSSDYFFEHPVDAIIIIAPGYTTEIYNIIRQKFGIKVDVYCLKTSSLEKMQ